MGWNEEDHPRDERGRFASVGLSVTTNPSSETFDRADPRAHEIKIVGKDGKVHYRMEIIRNSTDAGDMWTIGHVENVSREHKRLGEKLYLEAAAFAEQHGGRLVSIGQTNRYSATIQKSLVNKGYAGFFKYKDKTLLHIASTPIFSSSVEEVSSRYKIWT